MCFQTHKNRKKTHFYHLSPVQCWVQYSTGSVLDCTGHFSSVLDCIQSSTQYRSSRVQSSIQYGPVQRKSSTQYRLSNTVHIEYSTLQYAVQIQYTGTAVRSTGSNTGPVKTTIVDVLTFVHSLKHTKTVTTKTAKTCIHHQDTAKSTHGNDR